MGSQFYDVLVSRVHAGAVPVLDLVPVAPSGGDAGVRGADGARHPLVILYHGYSGMKELNVAHGYALARDGFRVLLPDAWGHGERAVPGIVDFVDACTKTAAEIDGLVERWAAQPGVDAARVGLCGYSMGGCITFAYLASGGRRVHAAAPVIGSPDWVSIFESPDARARAAELGVPADAAGRAAFLQRTRDAHPAARLASFTPVPMLVQVGVKDTLVPAGPVGSFCERLRPRYADASLLRYVPHPDVGHGETLPMLLGVAAWFRDRLGGPR